MRVFFQAVKYDATQRDQKNRKQQRPEETEGLKKDLTCKGSCIHFCRRKFTFQNKVSHCTKIFKIYVEVKYNTRIAIRKCTSKF